MSTIGERPGVYASYEVAGVSYSGLTSGTVGVAAAAASGTSGAVYTITTYAEAVSAFGAASRLTELVRILITNGVGTVKAVPLIPMGGAEPTIVAYAQAFNALAADADVKAILCDSRSSDVTAALKTVLTSADERMHHKIGIVEGTGTVATDTAAAAALNTERIVLVTPPAVLEDGTEAATGTLAAAVAGAVVTESDPAIPLNGAELYGVTGVSAALTDSQITTLVRGGVTPVECVGGKCTVVRGITTRTTTAGTADPTYRELTTTLIIDDVIPTVRNALAASFARSKNNAQTRGAIRTRVIMELEKKMAAEIIDGYDNVTVSVNANDPTVCDVSFEFTVAHGLNQIRLAAYITV